MVKVTVLCVTVPLTFVTPKGECIPPGRLEVIVLCADVPLSFAIRTGELYSTKQGGLGFSKRDCTVPNCPFKLCTSQGELYFASRGSIVAKLNCTV